MRMLIGNQRDTQHVATQMGAINLVDGFQLFTQVVPDRFFCKEMRPKVSIKLLFDPISNLGKIEEEKEEEKIYSESICCT